MKRMLLNMLEALVVSIALFLFVGWWYGSWPTPVDYFIFYFLYIYITDLRKDVKGV